MKLAFVYAGQGSQKVSMGKDFYEQFSSVRNVFDNAPVDFDLKKLCFEGPETILSQTKYTQPCMVAFAAAVTDLLKKEEIIPSVAAGLSLGEYSALYAAGAFDLEAVLSIVAYRGKIMQESTAGINSGMVAILGLSEEAVQQAVNQAKDLGVCEIANRNCSGQIVIGGEKNAVEIAAEHAKKLGAKRCVSLNVSGPFHTSLMEKASEKLAQKLDEITISSMQFPIVFNATGEALADSTKIRELLVKQIKSPVLFEQSIKTMESMGIDTIVEIGPGKVLSGFIKKTARTIRLYQIEDVPGFFETVKALKGEL